MIRNASASLLLAGLADASVAKQPGLGLGSLLRAGGAGRTNARAPTVGKGHAA